jgi:hypothetical protein
VLDALERLGADMMATVLDGLDEGEVERKRADLAIMKTNLRRAISRPSQQEAAE